MASHEWKGNVRELRHFIESMVVLDTDGILGLDDVQEDSELLRGPGGGTDGHAAGPGALVGRPLAEVERYYIEQALALTGGKREEAARLLGIGERTLYRVLKDWELQDRIKQTLAEVNDVTWPRLLDRIPILTRRSCQRKMKKQGLERVTWSGNVW